MKTIIRNWIDQGGRPDGGQACNDYFTIAWHRPSEEPGQNGAIVGEVLAQCYDWLSCENNNEPSPQFRSGIGYVIAFGDREISVDHKMKIIKPLLAVCESRLDFLRKHNDEQAHEVLRAIGWTEYAQSHLQYGFKTENWFKSIEGLKTAIEILKDVNPDGV